MASVARPDARSGSVHALSDRVFRRAHPRRSAERATSGPSAQRLVAVLR